MMTPEREADIRTAQISGVLNIRRMVQYLAELLDEVSRLRAEVARLQAELEAKK